VDDFTRECLALVADTSLSGRRVARELDKLIGDRGKPLRIPPVSTAGRSRFWRCAVPVLLEDQA